MYINLIHLPSSTHYKSSLEAEEWRHGIRVHQCKLCHGELVHYTQSHRRKFEEDADADDNNSSIVGCDISSC
jgi:hypothetical protein